jgi:hypothetical protein
VSCGAQAGIPGNFVSDIFREVDEEVRREQLNKLWERYQNLIFVGIFLILAAVGGWRGYEYYQTKRAAETGAAFEAAQTLSDEGKHAEAEAAYAKIVAEGAGSYRDLARVRQAAELAQREPKSAIPAYEKIADDGSVSTALRDLAALRAGSLLLDEGSFNETKSRLEPLASQGRPYRFTARELLAVAAWRAGDAAAFKRWSDMMATDIQTPTGTRARVEMLIALGAAGSGS